MNKSSSNAANATCNCLLSVSVAGTTSSLITVFLRTAITSVPTPLANAVHFIHAMQCGSKKTMPRQVPAPKLKCEKKNPKKTKQTKTKLS